MHPYKKNMMPEVTYQKIIHPFPIKMCWLETKIKTDKKKKLQLIWKPPKVKITYVHNVKTLPSSIEDEPKRCNKPDYNVAKLDNKSNMWISRLHKKMKLCLTSPLFPRKQRTIMFPTPSFTTPSIPPHPDAISLGQQNGARPASLSLPLSPLKPPPCNQVKELF